VVLQVFLGWLTLYYVGYMFITLAQIHLGYFFLFIQLCTSKFFFPSYYALYLYKKIICVLSLSIFLSCI